MKTNLRSPILQEKKNEQNLGKDALSLPMD
jgi:hypothetical protein